MNGRQTSLVLSREIHTVMADGDILPIYTGIKSALFLRFISTTGKQTELAHMTYTTSMIVGVYTSHSWDGYRCHVVLGVGGGEIKRRRAAACRLYDTPPRHHHTYTGPTRRGSSGCSATRWDDLQAGSCQPVLVSTSSCLNPGAIIT